MARHGRFGLRYEGLFQKSRATAKTMLAKVRKGPFKSIRGAGHLGCMPHCRKAALSPFLPLFGIAATDDIKSTKPTPDQNATCTLKEGVVLSGA